MFEAFDGSGRAPRKVQKDAFAFVQQHLGKTKFIAIEAKTGSGKSGIARAIQKELGGFILVPTNQLMNQYIDEYEGVNFVKGASHYTCDSQPEVSCEERRQVYKKTCTDCPYGKQKEKALALEPSFLNPMSRLYLGTGPLNAPVVVIDEAHKLEELLELATTVSFTDLDHVLPKSNDAETVSAWMAGQADKIKLIAESLKNEEHSKAKMIKYYSKAKSLRMTADLLQKHPEDYVISRSTKYMKKHQRNVNSLNINPIVLPQEFLDVMFKGADTVILLSATLPRFKVEGLTRGVPYAYISLENPIPSKNREVRLDYQNFNYQTPPAMIANWVKAQHDKYQSKATIVHVTYALGAKLKELIPEAMFHTNSAEKDETLETFKKKGGIWLAAGCAEGIDLKYDFARLNLIPIVPYANAKDPLVEARVKRFGFGWYERMTLLTMVQMVGRTTRASDDFSTTVVGDLRAAKLFVRYSKDLGVCFYKSIVWRNK